MKRPVVVKGRERRFVIWHRHAAGRGKVSTSAHLQGIDGSFRFK
jgi:hypothetical protein